MKNLMMIDIETSGTKPGCRVLTLGAFGFDRDGNQVEFYRRFDATKLREEGFTDDLSTVEWWCSKCSKEAYVEAFGGTDNPKDGIADFKQWCYRNFAMGNNDGFEAWCCGLDFDFPILGFFFEHYGYHFPWKFYDQRDLPDYHEESEEEREEREEQEAASRKFENVKEKIFNDKIKSRLEKAIERGDDEDLLAFIVAAGIDNCDLVTEKDRKEILEIEEDSYEITAEDLPASKGIEDIAKAVRSSLPSYVNHIYHIDRLKALYRIFCGGDADTLTPTDEEVQEEIDRQEAEKETEEE